MNKFFVIVLLYLIPSFIFGQIENNEMVDQEVDGHFFSEKHNKEIASVKRPDKSLQEHFDEAYQAFNSDRNVRVGKGIKLHPPLPTIYKEGEMSGLKLENDVLTPAEFEKINYFEAQSWVAKKDGKFGALNYGGEVAIPFVYSNLFQFKEGQISDYQVRHHNPKEKKEVLSLVISRYVAQDAATQKFGIIDGFNRLVLPFEYDKIEINHGYKYLTVEKNGKVGILDFKIKPIVPMEYEQVKKSNRIFWAVTQNGKTGLLQDEKIIVPLEYKFINPHILPCQKNKTVPTFFIASKGGKAIGLLNQEGLSVLPFEYQNIRPMLPIRGFSKPGNDCSYLFAVLKNEEWKVFDKDGKELVSSGKHMMREFLPLKNGKTIFFEFATDQQILIDPNGKVLEFKKHMLISTGYEFRDHKKNLEQKHQGKILLAMIFDQPNRKYTHYILDDGSILEME